MIEKYHRIRPWLGHVAGGVALGCALAIVVITTMAMLHNMRYGTVESPLLFSLAVWVLSLFVVAAIFGALSFTFLMRPYERQEWAARHAQRPVEPVR